MGAVRNAYDVIVVGSGPGGATVARELSRRGKRVLVLEWGSGEPIKGTMTQALRMSMMPGKGMLLTSELLGVVRGVATGGSSVFYYATAFEPPVDLFRSYGIEIADEIGEIREELPTQPLSDDLMGPMAKRIMASAQDLGYDWQRLPKFIYQDRCRAGCWRCEYGCPFGAKWNGRMFIDEAVENGAEIVNHAKVKRALIESGRAVGVEYARFGRTRRVYASRVVVSAGGLGSPLILRQTGIEGAGRDFFFDPLICVLGTVPDIKGGREIPMASGVHMEEEGYLMTDMTVPPALYAFFVSQVFQFRKLLSHERTLQIMIKAKDSLGGRLAGSGGVRKRLSEEDRLKLLRGYARAEEILRNAGAKDIFKTWYVAAHPGGTVKINHLVDADLKTKFDDLYVCDCSVIPESWGLPPTFTLIALGKRLAKHLAGESYNVQIGTQ